MRQSTHTGTARSRIANSFRTYSKGGLLVRQAGKDTEQPMAENSNNLTARRHYTILIVPGTNDKKTVSIFQ